MICSMSGYGSASASGDSYSLSVEIKTLNSRYLDFNIKAPRSLNFAENQIKNIVKEYIGRGRVDLYIQIEKGSLVSKNIVLNYEVLEQRLECLKQIKNMPGVEKELITVDTLSRFDDIFEYEMEEANSQELLDVTTQALREACAQMLDMRTSEGEIIERDLREKISQIKEIFEGLKVRASEYPKTFQDRLMERLQKTLNEIPLDEARFMTELVIYSDKLCIDEEITRFNSHIESFLVLLDEGKMAAKRLDFLIQEMNREVNTIGSKSLDTNIANYVVNLKNLIEMIREQVQNIE